MLFGMIFPLTYVTYKKYREYVRAGMLFLAVLLIILFLPFLGDYGQYLLIIVIALLFMRWSRIRLRAGSMRPGFIIATLSICSIFIIMSLLGLVKSVSLNPGVLSIIGYALALELLVAIGEELVFRHFIFQELNYRIGYTKAAILSSAGFAAIHFPSLLLIYYVMNISLVSLAIMAVVLFFLSIVLTVLYVYKGLFSVVAFHFSWNFLEYHFFNMAQIDSVLKVSYTGSILYTGYPFGPEASIIGLAVTSILLATVLYISRDKKLPVDMISRVVSTS